MSSQSTVTLRAGRLKLEISPSVGGAISAFSWNDGDGSRPILRQCPSPLKKVLDAGCFPLVPYVNRIRGGTFTFRGREVRLAPNMAGDPSPLHGQGWLNPWTVDSANDVEARLSFDHKAGEWPWDYHAEQDFTLDEGGLTLTITCRNDSGGPMPCGLGQHPYFPCNANTRIETIVTDAWTVDDKVLPVEKVRAEGRYDLRSRQVCGQGLDNGFGGWGGEARLSSPDWHYTVRLSSPDARFFQLYSPVEGSIFVAEPVTQSNAALNEPEEKWPELGMRVLEPGEAISMTMQLDVQPG